MNVSGNKFKLSDHYWFVFFAAASWMILTILYGSKSPHEFLKAWAKVRQRAAAENFRSRNFSIILLEKRKKDPGKKEPKVKFLSNNNSKAAGKYKFSKKFKAFGRNTSNEIFEEMIRTGKMIRNDIRKSMTSTQRSSRSVGGHRPSAPGHPPARKSGQLFRSIQREVRRTAQGGEVEIGSRTGAPYAVPLEGGADAG